MLTYDDCLAFSQMTKEDVDALSRHAHVPDLCAIELGAYLLQHPTGSAQVAAMLRDDIADAERRGDAAKAARIRGVLAHFQAKCTEGQADRGTETPR